MQKLLAAALAIAGAWWLFRRAMPANAEPAPIETPNGAPAPSAPPPAVENAGALAQAYATYPASTPVVYVGPAGEVVRETTAGELEQSFAAVALTGDVMYLPVAELPPRLAPGTGQVFAL